LGRRGFSLIEAMIAVIIAAIAVIGGFQLIIFTRVQNALEQERARAQQVVSEELERVRHTLYPRITGGKTLTVWDNGSPGDTTDDTIGTLEVIVRDPDGNQLFAAPVPAVRVTVEVTLSWNSRARLKTHTFRETMMTYIAP
jgi:prepilin-type N-terminal cleavage/methylation domain-containing protein